MIHFFLNDPLHYGKKSNEVHRKTVLKSGIRSRRRDDKAPKFHVLAAEFQKAYSYSHPKTKTDPQLSWLDPLALIPPSRY